jgi:hypothetical protein
MKVRLYFEGTMTLDVGDAEPADFLVTCDTALQIAASLTAKTDYPITYSPIEDWTAICRICGCTNGESCPGGCWWKEPDLCSSCDGEPIGSRPPAAT